MQDKLITIAQFEKSVEADMAKQKLESRGIKSVLAGQNATDLYGIPAIAEIDLQVLESQAEEATKILESNEPQEQ